MMGYFLAVISFLGLLQPTITQVEFHKGFQCAFSGTFIFKGEWSMHTFMSRGINVVFLVHNQQNTPKTTINLTRSITEGIVNYVRNFSTNIFNQGKYSLGLSTFSKWTSFILPLGAGINMKEPYNQAMKHAEDFLEVYKTSVYEDTETNIADVFLTAQLFFIIHEGNRIFAPNYCILLTTAPPDYPSLAAVAAKRLQDMGVSIIVIAIGEDVKKEDVEELASNTNVVFTARINESVTEFESFVENATTSITTAFSKARVLPRFSMCYQTYIDFSIIVDLSKDLITMISELTDFVAQFNMARVNMRVMIINSPDNDETFLNYYKQMVNELRRIGFEVYHTRHDMRSSMDIIRQYYQEEDHSRTIDANVLILVTDKNYVDDNDVIAESRACQSSGIHVMALGVGLDVSQDQFDTIISDPTGIVIVEDTEDIFWGLQSLNRKLCPAVCDRGWAFFEGMCYFYRDIWQKSWIDAKAECREFTIALCLWRWPCTCGQTLCNDGTCIPDSWIRDGIVDCNGATQEDENLDFDLCYAGKYRELYYLFAADKYKYVRPDCSMVFDGFGKHYDSYSDHNCNESILCPIGFYQCPSSYCIQLERVCDGTVDCLNGEDETGCAEYVCPGYFRCPGASYCFHPSRLCDGEVDCSGGKDEVMCHEVKCPDDCVCVAGLVSCGKLDSITIPLHHSTRKIVLTELNTLFPDTLLDGLTYLIEAVVTDVGLETVVGIFKDQGNLQILNISSNKIRSIPDYSLLKLENLKVLDLSFNQLENISEKSFTGLGKLKELHMKNSRLRILTEKSFLPLVNLEVLDLTGNGIHSVAAAAFSGLSKLRVLYMKHNDIEDFKQGIYDGLESVVEIQTDVFTLCCPQVRPVSVEEGKCLSPKASISSCDDLMANDFLRASIWILCISSLMGNILSIAMRILWEKDSMKIGFGVFVTHLGVSDFLMGVYLLIIAVADTRFKGVYIWKDHDWRESYYCKVAGFRATLSSEASTLFIFLITLDRFIVLKFPFGQVRFRLRSATSFSVIAWFIAFVMAGIPLLPSLDYWEFYSRNGACLALPFFTERMPGWEYSTTIFLGFNFVTFILIALGQYIIYRTMKQASLISSKERMAREMAVARRLLLIVSTDFLCWFPIGVMGLLAISGTTIGGEVYAWTAVFVLPVNSALNPFLYTIPAVLKKMRNGTVKNTRGKQKNGQKRNSSVQVGDLDPDSNMVLLEDVLLQFRSIKDKRRLVQMILAFIDESSVTVTELQPSPNAIYLSMKGKDVNSICITTNNDHGGGESSTFVLSLLESDHETDVITNPSLPQRSTSYEP